MYWIFLNLNTLPAILESILCIPYYKQTFIQKRSADSLRNALIAVYSTGFCLTCVTMFVLMLSVYKIRKFYKDNQLTKQMNTKAMAIHVLTFGGYVLSAFVINAVIILTFFYPGNRKVYEALDIITVPVTVTSTIAQVLLCTIFW
jgi:hypothetical protein